MPRWTQNCGVRRLPLDFRDQYFGCEIELTGINRATAAQTLADFPLLAIVVVSLASATGIVLLTVKRKKALKETSDEEDADESSDR